MSHSKFDPGAKEASAAPAATPVASKRAREWTLADFEALATGGALPAMDELSDRNTFDWVYGGERNRTRIELTLHIKATSQDKLILDIGQKDVSVAPAATPARLKRASEWTTADLDALEKGGTVPPIDELSHYSVVPHKLDDLAIQGGGFFDAPTSQMLRRFDLDKPPYPDALYAKMQVGS